MEGPFLRQITSFTSDEVGVLRLGRSVPQRPGRAQYGGSTCSVRSLDKPFRPLSRARRCLSSAILTRVKGKSPTPTNRETSLRCTHQGRCGTWWPPPWATSSGEFDTQPSRILQAEPHKDHLDCPNSPDIRLVTILRSAEAPITQFECHSSRRGIWPAVPLNASPS